MLPVTHLTVSSRYREAPARRLTAWRPVLALALPAILASCGGDDHCFNCFVTPVEYSRGVVSADFNGDGFADIAAPEAPSMNNVSK